jgi:hypothetical protein
MGRNREHDWLRAELEFVCSLENCTLKDIAERYNIPYQSVRRYASKNQWRKKREYWRCCLREAFRLKLAIKLGMIQPEDIINGKRVTIYDLACNKCRHLDPDRMQ